MIIWDMEEEQLTPRVKYPHNSTVQKVKFSPLSNARLISCATIDFGLFAPDSKDVSKTSTSSRITDCAWSPLGDKIALSSQSGQISIRNSQNGAELAKFKVEGWYIVGVVYCGILRGGILYYLIK